jgi:hypothetical protein
MCTTCLLFSSLRPLLLKSMPLFKGGVQDDNLTNPTAFRSWDDICQTKENGGLGIRDLYIVNKSLLTQASWNIVTNKNPFLTSVLKAYYHNTSFWIANTSGPRSIFWSSILQVKKSCAATLSTKSMQGTVPFGPRLGVLFGTPYMTIYFYLSLTLPYLQQFLAFGCLTLVLGMFSLFLMSLITRLYRQSLCCRLSLVTI